MILNGSCVYFATHSPSFYDNVRISSKLFYRMFQADHLICKRKIKKNVRLARENFFHILYLNVYKKGKLLCFFSWLMFIFKSSCRLYLTFKIKAYKYSI